MLGTAWTKNPKGKKHPNAKRIIDLWKGGFKTRNETRFQTSPAHFPGPSRKGTPINSPSQEKSERNAKESADNLHIDPAKKEDI